MARRGGASLRDAEKEAYWRKVLIEWRHSGLSQAAFCRSRVLNTNTFSSWKTIIRERDTERTDLLPKPGRARSIGQPQKSAASPARFVRLEVDNNPPGTYRSQAGPVNRTAGGTNNPAASLAAGLFLPSTDCCVRIYNGADPATLSALISALALS